MSDKYQLISFNLCPFVQRSAIALEEKNVPYDIEYIDLANKPDWFLKISPLGKVPVLRVDDTALFESQVIAEFIEETTPPPRLHPESPLRRAQNRAWIEVISQLIGDSHRLGVATDEAKAREAAKAARDKLQRLEGQIVGPLFNGNDFSLVDAAAAPALQRLTWCNEIESSLQLFAGLPKTTAWRDALLQRPSVQRSTVDGIRDIYCDYLRGRGSPTRKTEPSWLGKRLGVA